MGKKEDLIGSRANRGEIDSAALSRTLAEIV
jgi:hypothetical protein